MAIIQTSGNEDCHVIHRGGNSGPNYDKKSVAKSVEVCKSKGIKPSIMIDCSHGNSGKDYRNQPTVATNVAKQVSSGDQNHSNNSLKLKQCITDGMYILSENCGSVALSLYN